jgi:hypothetical protein
MWNVRICRYRSKKGLPRLLLKVMTIVWAGRDRTEHYMVQCVCTEGMRIERTWATGLGVACFGCKMPNGPTRRSASYRGENLQGRMIGWRGPGGRAEMPAAGTKPAGSATPSLLSSSPSLVWLHGAPQTAEISQVGTLTIESLLEISQSKRFVASS